MTIDNKAIDFMNVDKNAKIAVAMSGGVDSSTAVALLKEAGYKNIVGLTLILYENNADKGIVCKDQTIKDDCNRVAKDMNIEHHFIELKEEFMEEIINPFLMGYMSGITVNPCITCNRDIKFGYLLRESEKINAQVLVTGHYIKWQKSQDGYGYIYRSNNAGRDQSYFLSQTRKESLQKLRFPLANFSKAEVRAHAERLNIHVAQKKASSDLCFTGDLNYTELMKKTQENIKKGNIVDLSGKILGQHEGIHHFTIGQRKGIGIGGTAEPYFVIKINPDDATVVVGPKEALAVKELMLNNINWLGEGNFDFSTRQVLAKVRSTQLLTKAELIPSDLNNAKIIFEEEILGVAKGQVCAFYDENDMLLGGGYI